MAKQILLTGGAGYIGSNTALELLNAGYEVVIVDNFCNSDEKLDERLAGIPVYKADVTKYGELAEVFGKYDFHAVIHFAALKAVGVSVREPLEYYANNVGGLLTTLRLMQAHGVNRIVYSSSATVYDPAGPLPYTETSPVGNANSPYGQTKVICEQIIRDYTASNPGFTAHLLRYFNPIKGAVKEKPRGVPNNLYPYIQQVHEGLREKLTVNGNDYPTRDGTCVRDYIDCTKIAQSHIAPLEAETPGLYIKNIGTGNGTTVLELIRQYEQENNCVIPYEIGPRRAGDIPECYCAG
ncbi:MAG: UDP-glucose 4-epimerase GalE [Oscillospiraceae bacterium]|jgi:UDP-glucose 4-epimerase|nr:UDP-glucose 4-epimerase GalE [Oscillospiraceae bacterium]